VSSFYDLKTSYLDGKAADLGTFRGKVTLAVNVASYCGYTPQYQASRNWNRDLSSQGFAVLGFPSKRFREQEPGTPEEIGAFCKRTYDVTFPMFSKVVTKSGAQQSPVYKSWAPRGICRPGTSASTSSARTATSSPSSRAR